MRPESSFYRRQTKAWRASNLPRSQSESCRAGVQPGPADQSPGEGSLPDPGLTVLCFHVEAESQILATVQQPVVTGCCHVQHQPALVLSSERLKIQKEQVRLPVDTKEQLTEAGTAAFMFPVPTWGPLLGRRPSWP